MLEKDFVPYELAVKLEELGFDKKCIATIDQTNYIHIKGTRRPIRGAMVYNTIDCPTFSQAFRWFREKNIYATINTYHSVNEDKPFGLSIDYLHKSGKWDYFDYRGESDFETYEEAELACLTKLIEIVETRIK